MAKGSLFVGSGSGKVGNLVLANTKSGQVTRAYQPKVSNPKTIAQMLQRAKFANAVKFFQQMTSGFFKFAFEDKKQNESDYNAYMRHNLQFSLPTTQEAYKNPYAPAVGNQFLLSKGRLSLPSLCSMSANTSSGESSFKVASGVADGATTVGQLSSALIAMGFLAGDIVTIVQMESEFSLDNYKDPSADIAGKYNPNVSVRQFIIDTDSTVLLADINVSGSGGSPLTYENNAVVIDQTDLVRWCGMVVSREVDGALYVTTSYFHPNVAAINIVEYLTSSVSEVLSTSSWGAKGNAILKGSIAAV